jgi:3-hydroxy-9,10-secoandrosta-1,3,5(10)-triene-9,17-dione monooxygenase
MPTTDERTEESEGAAGLAGLGQAPEMSPAQLVAQATAMVPTLRERSAHCEELRKLPPETVADIRAAGFPRIAQPTEFGGRGLRIDDAAEVALEIGRGCCSTAWVSALWSGHNFMVSTFERAAQEEYWADSFDTLASTASAVVKLDTTEEAGGLRMSGKFRYSSGCDYADWLILFIPAGMCLIPRQDFRIEDDWYVAGLRGTGSKAVVVEDILVPNHRQVPMASILAGDTFGTAQHPDNPFYRLGPSIQLAPLLLGPIVGMARGLVELFDERVVKRIDLHTGLRACERPATQLRYAEATAEVDTATLLFRTVNESLKRLGSSGEAPGMLDRARIRRDVVYAVKLCIQAADRLLESGDSSGMADSQLIQRWGRDIHMAGLQFMATWDEPAMAYSQLRWGLEPQAHTI